MKIYIDPGNSGAIAYRQYNGDIVVEKMPVSIPDMLEFFRELEDFGYNNAILENVGRGRPVNGVKAISTFANHYGRLEMALYAAGIGVTKVAPNSWMKLIPGKLPKDYRQRKNAIKEFAATSHPSLKVTLWNADAIAMMTVLEK